MDVHNYQLKLTRVQSTFLTPVPCLNINVKLMYYRWLGLRAGNSEIKSRNKITIYKVVTE